MSLDEYRRKRKFAFTPEPKGPDPGGPGKSRRFVIQKHDATRLHYDFRLEMRGVLKSWAVPKGISMDPGVKRLAVLTEDHPLDYVNFEGVIPEKNYGAGTVIVWDSGTYSTGGDMDRQFREGKILFTLKGLKVKGAFSLVRMKKEERQWLLIKSKDEFATSEDLALTRPGSVLSGKASEQLLEGRESEKAAPLPALIRPMLAVPVDKPFDDKDWIFEVKWDGVRCIYLRDKARKIRALQARKGTPITHRYPEIVEEADSAIRCGKSVVLDGEIVVLDKDGLPDFQKHQQRMNVDQAREIEKLAKEIPVTYFVFDILYLDGKNLKPLSFTERRKILWRVIAPGSRRIRISDYIEKDGTELFRHASEMELEGIVAKYKRGRYLEGTRSDSWLKIKGTLTQDCIVIGYTRGEGNREGYFGSLILAAYQDGRLRFVGHSGSGFGFDQLAMIYRLLQRLGTKRCPIDSVPYVNRTPTWVIPELVVEVKFNGWTRDGIMRAPIFVRLREDKSPGECTIEKPRDAGVAVAGAESAGNGQDVPAPLSNPDKVFWPATGGHRALTKSDLIGYYEKISRYILPHLRDRPVSMSRYPDGIAGKSFYQKDWSQKAPNFVRTIQVFSETRDDVINYVVCNNKETLLWLVNLGCIEMHPWYSRVRDYEACTSQAKKGRIEGPAPLDEDMCGLDTPDFIIFDLDPYIYSGKERKGEEPEYNIKGFKAALDVAMGLKNLLDELGIEGFAKTSGKTGLHVFIPVSPDYSYGQTRAFAEIVGRILARRHPEQITMEWNTSRRRGKVFFDYNQNARGKTIASVLSTRPTASATVSMPLSWKEMARALPTDFTIDTVPELLKRRGDPWRDVLKKKQDIAQLLDKVQSLRL